MPTECFHEFFTGHLFPHIVFLAPLCFADRATVSPKKTHVRADKKPGMFRNFLKNVQMTNPVWQLAREKKTVFSPQNSFFLFFLKEQKTQWKN